MLSAILLVATLLQPMLDYNELSGEETMALRAAYQTLPARAQHNISKTTVWISKSTGAFAVDFESAKSTVRVTVDYEGRARSIRVLDGPILALPGVDAKAIAIAGEAWLSRAVYCEANSFCKSGLPDPTAVRSGAFTVREYFVPKSAAGDQAPAYVVSYLPSGKSWDYGAGLHCPSYTTYTVDASTFRVYLQPKIC